MSSIHGGITDIREDFLALTKDGIKTSINFSDDEKSVYVEHDIIGDYPLYSVKKNWNASDDLKYLEYAFLCPPSIYTILLYHNNGNPRFEFVSHKGSNNVKEYYANGNLKQKGSIIESGQFDGYGTRYTYTDDQKTVIDGIFKNGEFREVQRKIYAPRSN
eukprot:481218_1